MSNSSFPAERVAPPAGPGAPSGERFRRIAGRSAALPAHIRADALRRRMLAGADAVALVAADLLAVAGPLAADEGFWVAVLLPVGLVLAKLTGLYDLDHRGLRHLTVDELGPLTVWATLTAAAAALLMSLTPAGPMPATGAVALWAALLVLAPVARATARLVWRRITRPSRTLLVGSGPLERATRRKLELFDDIHAEVVGQVAVRDIGPLMVGTADGSLRRACGGVLPDRVIVCAADVHEPLLANLVAFCRLRRMKLSVVPPLRGMFGTAVRLSHVSDLPVVEYHTADASASTVFLKRLCDVVVAGAALIITAPLMLAIAAAIRLDSRGPALYVQRRAGRGGEPFPMLKFRTMTADAERRLDEVVRLDELEAPVFKLRRDPRVTRVGRLLRRWSVDELPQLWNVLRGDMSLVGPRPEELAVVERYRPEHRFRLEAAPGMTGPMQVYGRGELDFDERLAVEREYLENMTLGRDLRVLLLTIPAVLSGRGAF